MPFTIASGTKEFCVGLKEMKNFMKFIFKNLFVCSLILLTASFTLSNGAERSNIGIVRNDSLTADSLVLRQDTIKSDSVENKDTIIVNPEGGQWTATYYGNTYKGVRHTANGDRFDMNAMTCAAPKKYKFGTYLRVENKANGKSVIVRVTDRGGFGNRCIDLTYGAFAKIASHRTGKIRINVYNLGDKKPV